MKTYTTVQATRIASGTLALSSAQASARHSALRKVGDGLYEVLSPIEFKIGETFGYDLELPRALIACLEESGKALEDMDRESLLVMARSLGLNPSPKTGKPKLIEAIKARQDELLAEQEAAEAKAARIAELEALGDAATDEEKAELKDLKA